MKLNLCSHAFLLMAVFVNVSCQRSEIQYPTHTVANIGNSALDKDESRNQPRSPEWKTVLSGSVSSISFADEKHGIATGASEYYWLTSDGGITWNEHNIRPEKVGTYGENNLVRSVMSRSGTVFAIGHVEDAGSEIFGAQSPFKIWKVDTYLGHSVNDLSVIDNYAWVVGNSRTSGFILHTKDSVHWEKIWKSDKISLAGVYFLDKATGWCAGGDGTIMHTKDGGRTWRIQATPIKENLLSVTFVDSQNGYAVGVKGTILHTTTGGETWDEQISGTDNHLTHVVAGSANEAWAIGNNLTLLHTKDAGRHWIKQSVPLDSAEYSSINGIALRDKQVWLVSGGSILYFDIK